MSENDIKEETNIGKLKVNGIGEKLFVIPFYQRGYRWTENEATKLLDDLVEFAQSGETEYCLQPIVLQTIEIKDCEKYENFPKIEDDKEILRVVDGQQRLTTIALILNVLGIEHEWDIYYVAEKKKLSEILDPHDTDEKTTINDYFREQVQEAIQTYFNLNVEKGHLQTEEQKKRKRYIETLFSKQDLKPNKSVSFIRYDISKDDSDTEGHQAFLRLNAGKTPLTSSELIRALYMVNASNLSLQERMEISKEWEIIENTLRDEQFWLMFNSIGLSDTPTRIDLLFALVLGVSLENTKANPRIVFEKLDNGYESNNVKYEYDLRKIWREVLRCFWWMQSCYADIEVFNYLCWINEFTENSAKTIYDKWRTYPKPEDFKKSIISIIQGKYENQDFHFEYGKDAKTLRALFVLLNLLDCNHSKERFRFDLYKSQKWDIEHIDSQTPNELKDDKSKKEWLETSWNELSEEQKTNLSRDYITQKKGNQSSWENLSGDEKNEFTGQFLNPKDFDKNAKEIIEILKKDLSETEKINIKDENSLGNLALLNTTINRSYKNAIFPVKRKTIKGFIDSGECYIPPCTQKAFMKFYTESPSKITYWLQADFDGYSKTMEALFDDFQKIETELLGSQAKKTDILKENKPENEEARKTADDNTVEKNNNETIVTNESTERISDAIDFITFMNKYKIIIPKIQRLYVQGRNDSYGQKCLSSFASHLVDCVTGKENNGNLDFIYGIDNGSEFYPLDGQQRLTTLLLLSWICGKTEKNWSFKYDSRRATEYFIEGLLQSPPPKIEKPSDYESKKGKKEYLPLCSEYIKKSDWFLSAWEQDSGIAGMLAMLDSLYCKLLESEKKGNYSFEKITFFVNYLDAGKASYDQIFLKMNSRGRELTEWENIKATLDKYVPNENKSEWKTNLENWQELLWKRFSKGEQSNDINPIDTKMLSVVELALSCAGYKENAKDTFKLSNWFEDETKKENKEEFYSVCSTFFSALDNLNTKGSVYNDSDLNTALKPNWFTQSVITDFAKENTESFYKPLLAYYAAKQSINKDWMRVVWNIVENGNLDKENFVSAYKLIKELSEKKDTYKDNILNFLASANEIKSQFAKEQVAEEREKAKKICESDEWKNKIETAEKYGFFKGAIRFLFRDNTGNWNWDNFYTKWVNAQKYFARNGIKQEYQVDLTKALVIQCNNWKNQLYDKQIFNPNSTTWKWILTANNWINPIHNILMNISLDSINKTETMNDKYVKQFILPIIDSLPYKEIIKKEPKSRFKWNGQLGLYKPRGQNPIIFDWFIRKRNAILSSLCNTHRITSNQKIKDCDFFWGLDINFTYKKDTSNYHFKWKSDEIIYLLNESKNERQKDKDGNDIILATYSLTTENFLSELDTLIDKIPQ